MSTSTAAPPPNQLPSAYTYPPTYFSPSRPTPTPQSTRNAEKQAIRDAWARNDNAQTTPLPTTPVQTGLISINPSRSSGSGSASRSGLGLGSGNLGHRGYIPQGMDVRDALARCEDPTLGWSLQFWVTIADPVNQHVFFACPASGQCSWDPPVGAFVVPRSADGEWWELADKSRNNRSYYYNTLSGKTQWTRPGGDSFVIPLGLIQANALPPRRGSIDHSTTHLSPYSAQTPQTRRRTTSLRPPPDTPETSLLPGRTAPRTPRSYTSPDVTSPGQDSRPMITRVQSDPTSPVQPATPLSIVDEGSGNETDLSDNAGRGPGWWDKRKSKRVGKKGSSPRKRTGTVLVVTMESEEEGTDLGRARRDGSRRIANGDERDPDMVIQGPVSTGESALPRGQPLEPIYVDTLTRTKRMSTGLHPLMDPAITSEIQAFQTDDFASKYFATKRTGVLRHKVPLERIMEWQKQPITSPLLLLSRHLTREALMTFKVIQHVMGERDRAVDGARPIPGSTSSSNLVGVALRRDETRGRIGGSGEGARAGEKVVVLEEIRWMIQVCVSQGEMRDEVYCQVVKQLTKNPDHDAAVLGFQLFCVLVNAFGPSKNFEGFARSFLKKHLSVAGDGIGVMAKYCLAKLDGLVARGWRGKALTVGEIEHASDAAFYPSVYGESLDKIMDLQARSYPSAKVPVILPFLADGILALGGTFSEGIFRVPGDGDSVSELKSRMDRGHYQLKGIDDPYVAASLFKLWLRELETPVIPTEMYNQALAASRSSVECLGFVKRLPTYNRRVLVFVISFIQLFISEEVVEVTKMTPQNLALVLAPNILRTTSDHLVTVFTNSSFESRFVLQLLEHLKPEDGDSVYVPVHGPAMRKTEGIV